MDPPSFKPASAKPLDKEMKQALMQKTEQIE